MMSVEALVLEIPERTRSLGKIKDVRKQYDGDLQPIKALTTSATKAPWLM